MTLTIDTSGLLALLNQSDTYHSACVVAYRRDGGPYFISAAILSEIAWFLEDRRRFPVRVEREFLADLRAGAYTIEWSTASLIRIQELVERYHDLNLGIADAAVIECAERHSGRVLTTDFRHFPVVARGERTFAVLPS